MEPIFTKFTKLMNIASPIVAAPMAFATTADMITAVTAAGAFGFLGAGFDTSQKLKQSLQSIRTGLKLPKNAPLPVGIGFLGWILDMTEASDDPRIAPVLDELPSAVWFAFGVDLGKYILQVRAHDAKREHKTLVFVIVNSVAEALRAVNEWKVDVLVVQGLEAGGHGGAKAPFLSNLLAAVLTAIPNAPPILAAGGVTTGPQVASLLIQGASGVVMGTRFLYTPECEYSEAMKEVLIAADLNATERSMAFDEVNRTMGWPSGINGRAIDNSIMDDHREGLGLEERMKKHDEAKAAGNKSHLVIWAGVGVGLTNDIRGAADVVREVHSEAFRSLKAASSFIG